MHKLMICDSIMSHDGDFFRCSIHILFDFAMRIIMLLMLTDPVIGDICFNLISSVLMIGIT